jgi:hypothetical protein
MPLSPANRRVLFRKKPPVLRNLTRQNMAGLNAMVRGVINQNARRRFLLLGNSTVYASNADGTSASQKVLSIPYYLAQQLNAMVCAAEIDSMAGAGHNSSLGGFEGYDNRITHDPGGAQLSSTQDSLGGRFIQTLVANALVNFAPGTGACNYLDFTYLEPAAGRFGKVWGNGSPIYTIAPSSGAASTPKRVLIPIGSSVTSVSASADQAGSISFAGFHTYDDSVFKISITGAGIPGATLADLIAISNAYDPGNGLSAWINPGDVVAVECIINVFAGNVALSSVAAQLNSLYTLVTAAGGQLIIILGNEHNPNYNSGANPRSKQDAYRQVYIDFALSKGLIIGDVRAAIGFWEEVDRRGEQQDQSHLYASGNARVSRSLFVPLFQAAA